tara:strand:+ start:185 stop:559 length:375 start_codon:yes stop_codon:yes gene_type:complete
LARISGVDLPKNKKIEYALTYIFGIGLKTAQVILNKISLETDIKVKDLTEDDILKIRNELQNYELEGDLKRKISRDIRRLHEIGCYRGSRHKRRLPVRGQRTHTNARSKKGKRIAIAGKKKVTK